MCGKQSKFGKKSTMDFFLRERRTCYGWISNMTQAPLDTAVQNVKMREHPHYSLETVNIFPTVSSVVFCKVLETHSFLFWLHRQVR